MHADRSFNRRTFIKTFAVATAYSSVVGKSWTNILAAEVQPLSTSTTGLLRIKLTDFPALQSESGSVRLAINPLRGGPPNGPTPNGQFYPVIINRGPNDTFFALNSRCTHQNCVVDPLDPSSNRMTCPCHASVFAIDGRRIAGLAPSGLARYVLNFDGRDTLAIQIPSLGYSVTAANVQDSQSANRRVRLSFRGIRNVSYEVQARESFDKPAAPAMFSLTAEGALDQTEFTAATTGDVNLFVEPKARAAFYSVAVRLTEV